MRVAIVGIGNCASSLLQSLLVSRDGLTRTPSESARIGKVRKNIEIVAGFDIDERKINRAIGEAALQAPNCTTVRETIRSFRRPVHCGVILDSIGDSEYSLIQPSPNASRVSQESVIEILRQSGAELLVSFLPVGSQQASEFYARAAMEAGASFLNCTPSVIARSPQFQHEFAERGLLLMGDDLKSHIGASALNEALVQFLVSKGVHVASLYQLNFGGNSDFYNMLDPRRAALKKDTKHLTVEKHLSEVTARSIGPAGYVDHLKDRKVCYLHIDGTGFMNFNYSMEVRLEVEDSPNAAAVVLDLISYLECGEMKRSSIPKEVYLSAFKAPSEW